MSPKPAADPMSDTPEMAKRIGTLFVLAMQTNDAELREAAHLDKSELGMQDGPIFLPVATLLHQRDALVKALEEVRSGLRNLPASATAVQIDEIARAALKLAETPP